MSYWQLEAVDGAGRTVIVDAALAFDARRTAGLWLLRNGLPERLASFARIKPYDPARPPAAGLLIVSQGEGHELIERTLTTTEIDI